MGVEQGEQNEKWKLGTDLESKEGQMKLLASVWNE
jgi:hypothetical protein